MKIGELVKSNIKNIFNYCDTIEHEEIQRLLDEAYSKEVFNLNTSFCFEASLIPKNESKRYWTDVYVVRGITVRVSSQWYERQRKYFENYLKNKNIVIDTQTNISQNTQQNNTRYKGKAIGNAQNLVIRNILSNLGTESFNKTDWEKTIEYFSNSCAYCGERNVELVMEHAIPINRKSLGEHRIGNLVPSCKPCNSSKHDKDFRIFLGEDNNRINKIEEYMDSKNYVPLGDNEQVRMILDMAYKEVPSVSKRYVKILNELFSL